MVFPVATCQRYAVCVKKPVQASSRCKDAWCYTDDGYEAAPGSAAVALPGAEATIALQTCASFSTLQSCAQAEQPQIPQVFASRVTALELPADGTGLYAGCDAASPQRDPDAVDAAPVKLLAVQVRPATACAFIADCTLSAYALSRWQDGKELRSLQSDVRMDARLLKAVRQHGPALLCVDGQR